MHEARSDEELLELWSGGDRQAGDALFERHFECVCRFLHAKVHAGLEDLVQQVFLACVEARERFEGKSSFRAFLLGIARHKLLDHLRERKQLARLDFGVTSLSSLGTTPTGALARNDERRLLLQALQRLPADQQIALELTYWEDLNGRQLSEVLEVPVATAYTRLRRARQRLRRALQELHAPALAPEAEAELRRVFERLRPP